MKEEMVERIHKMALRTWSAIGADALINEDGEFDESVTLTRDEVIEIVGDADRMLYYGGDKEAYEEYLKIDGWDAKCEILEGAFKFEVYGY